MKLLTLTLQVAFQDSITSENWTEGVIDILERAAVDGMEAEVCIIREVERATLDHPDLDFEAEDAEASIQGWQDRARDYLAATRASLMQPEAAP